MVDFDRIGYWSEIKLEIVKSYATAYSKIISAQSRPKLKHVYIDAFSGPGVHLRKGTEEWVSGSPLNALLVSPPFAEYWFIDLDADKIDHLRTLVGSRLDVHCVQGDCNDVLMTTVFPQVRFEDYRRALCLIDPYKLNLSWQVLWTAGQQRSIEIFLNFPVMDMNRNILWRDSSRIDARQAERMTRFWGDESWRQAAYDKTRDLFGYEEKTENDVIAEAFRHRLGSVAGFAYVPTPIPMRNDQGATVYYLFFASPNRVGHEIVEHIFDKFRDYGKR